MIFFHQLKFHIIGMIKEATGENGDMVVVSVVEERCKNWNHFHPFHHHHPLSYFSVQKCSPPPLQMLRGELLARMVHTQWSLADATGL